MKFSSGLHSKAPALLVALLFQIHPAIAEEAPKPGTVEYFLQNIQGRYFLKDDTLVEIQRPYFDAVNISGTIIQVLDGNNVIIETKNPRPSGAMKRIPIFLHYTPVNPPILGQNFSGKLVRSGSYACVNELGETNVLRGYTAPEAVSFEQYLEVYQRENTSRKFGRIVAFTNTVSVSEQSETMRRLSYAERLQRRRAAEEQRMRELAARPELSTQQIENLLEQYQMDVIRKGQEPLPIPLSSEAKDQLIREGVLPENQ